MLEGEYYDVEDNTNYKSISCENIPERFLDKLIAKQHFSKFGKINRFILRPGRLQCTIDYENEEEAKLALINGAVYGGQYFLIKYTENGVSQVRNTEEWVDPDIQAELDAMGNIPQKSYRSAMLSPPIFTAKPIQPRLPKTILKTKPTQSSSMESRLDLPLPSSAATKIDVGIKNDLENIMRRQATTAEEKCNVLDARDKLLRLKTTRTTDIKKAVSTKGTCPDMCPEKERWLRETRNQISVFELEEDSDTMDHKIAIKEYSRSSADQEAPLPHELRPESVLKMTMTYLLNHIMDLCDDENVNIGDWYHFVWDRTRSIRKDITQQDLCSLGAVELIEQCARFHIHCAARLVAEDSSVFDQRINTENLTKCLQSLKYMYHDLRIKNIKCINEAEFRAYIILLNLNDSNFLWEVKQLPEEIQRSYEIKMAINFYLAVANNNFVKFFKLIKQTSYLNACILMRYFHQVRNSAIRTMSKAYNGPRQVTASIPLKYLIDILAFESNEDAINFFEHYGLECDSEKVIIDKNWMYESEMFFQMERAIKVVESKRKKTVGTVICGTALGSLDILKKHIPHSSFDKNGFLIHDGWTSKDQPPKLNTSKRIPESKNLNNTPDNIFKIPTSSPPISPKQQQQQNLKSIFGMPLQKIDPAPPLEIEQKYQHSSKPAVSSIFALPVKKIDPAPKFEIQDKPKIIPVTTPSIFGSNQLSPTTAPSIFGSPKFLQESKPKEIFDIFQKPKNTTPTIFISSESTSSSRSSPIPPSESTSTSNSPAFSIFSKNSEISNPSLNIFGTETSKENTFTDSLFIKQNVSNTDNIFQHFSEAPKNIFQRLGDKEMQTSIFDSAKENEIQQQQKMEIEEKVKQKKKEIEMQIALEKQKLLEIEKIKQLEKQKEDLVKKQRELEEKMKKDQASIKAEKLNEINITSKEILTKLIKELEKEIINEISQNEIENYERINLNAKIITQDIFDECIDEILTESIEIELNKFNILKKYFLMWNSIVKKNIERRQLIQSTPIWMTGEDINDLASKIAHPEQKYNLEMMKRYRLGIPKEFNLSMGSSIKKINLFTILAKELHNGDLHLSAIGLLKSRRYCKFIISLPKDNEEIKGFNSYISSFLDDSIERKREVEQSKGILCETHSNLSICLRKISGVFPLNEQNKKVTTECDHATGLIFFMTLTDLSSSRRRLNLLMKLAQINMKIPVAILLYKSMYDMEEESIEQDLGIEDLKKLNKISFCEIFTINENSLNDGFVSAINFLGKNFNLRTDLEMQSFISFLQTTIADEIWRRLHDSWMINQYFRIFCTQPTHIVHLYNQSIDKLINLIEEDFQDCPEFPIELKEFVPKSLLDIPQDVEYFPNDWKSEKRSFKIISFLNKIKLKTIDENWPTDIKELEIKILDYSAKCIPICEKSTRTAGYSAIKALLERLNNPELLDLPLENRLDKISWLQIFKPIALELLTLVWKNENKYIPIEIIYRKSKFKEFISTPWWLEDEIVNEIKIIPEDYFAENGNTKVLKESIDYESNEENLEPMISRGYEAIEKASENIEKYYECLNTTRKISENLGLSFYKYETKTKLNERNTEDQELYFSPPKVKRIKTTENSNDEIGDVIAKAFSVIEKVEKRMDIRKKCDQLFSEY